MLVEVLYLLLLYVTQIQDKHPVCVDQGLRSEIHILYLTSILFMMDNVGLDILFTLFQNFYKEKINREEMYIRYIKKLFDLHFAAKNYVEAGLTLQLYAQLLQWRDHIKQEELGFHAETEWERKENLYLKVLDCFDKGKVFIFLFICSDDFSL